MVEMSQSRDAQGRVVVMRMALFLVILVVVRNVVDLRFTSSLACLATTAQRLWWLWWGEMTFGRTGRCGGFTQAPWPVSSTAPSTWSYSPRELGAHNLQCCWSQQVVYYPLNNAKQEGSRHLLMDPSPLESSQPPISAKPSSQTSLYLSAPSSSRPASFLDSTKPPSPLSTSSRLTSCELW
jgi:hypothetical protein